jgi:hypothetical protein
MVTIVGTVRNSAATTHELEAIFPYNLCVIEVNFSADDLERAAGALEIPVSWLAEPSPALDRVVLHVPFVSESLLADGASGPIYMVNPLIVPAA